MTGIICINKEKDITSFGVVRKVRGITGVKKAGHTGTLDPMATGVLPVMLGGATRFLDFLPDSDKGYRASFILGKTTDTLDITGGVLTENEVNAEESDVENTLDRFRGEISQIPPMYSAVSVDGKRLYDLARQGIEVERQARKVEIKKLELVQSNPHENEYTIDVVCTKGTYIRTLIDDIGRELGCGAVMTSLVRTLAMGFTLDDCVTLDELQQIKDCGGDFSEKVLEIDKAFSDFDKVYITEPQAKRFSNGGWLDTARIKAKCSGGLCRVYAPGGEFLGLGGWNNEENQLSVKRLLVR